MIILWTKCIVKTKNEYTYKVSRYTYISTEYLWWQYLQCCHDNKLKLIYKSNKLNIYLLSKFDILVKPTKKISKIVTIYNLRYDWF